MPTELNLPWRLWHTVGKLVHCQSAANHGSVGVPWLAGGGVFLRVRLQPLQVIELRGDKNGCSPFVQDVARLAGRVLWLANRHRAPIEPQILCCERKLLIVKAELV